MKPALERWLLQRWYGGAAPGPGLRALAQLYGGLMSLRDTAFSRGWRTVRRVDAIVVVVGNFTAGGTGKTPLIVALAQHLQSRGFRPGIVSRGHGRASHAPIRVENDTAPALCGDEPRLVFERTGLPVFVDADRVAAAQRAIDAGCDLILADDGLQHRRLARDVEIEVVDGARRYGNGRLIPAGPLREPPRDTGLRVINGADAGAAGEWRMDLQLSGAVSLATGEQRPLPAFAGQTVHALAGIGNPARFFHALRGQGLTISEHPFPDHHAYRPEDFAGMIGPILMTEKDAVKCRGLGLDQAWSVPVEAVLAATFYAALDARIAATRASTPP
jgi:tetraacyldisaccharide 4'-kinase